MSSKIKALNEEELSFETDPETNGKPSKEAQEELSISKYNDALKTLKEGRRRDAVDLLEEIVSDDDLKQLSLPLQKLQLGCLKILGDLYRDGDCKNLERCKTMYERAIYYDQAENNINFWYRLGKVCFEIGDVYSAHMAFGHALHLRPGHWGCLEHMVTISYAIQDYTGCIRYCSSGLLLDSGFYKGKVFQELVYSVLPELERKDGGESWDKSGDMLPVECQLLWKEKYLEELRRLQERAYQRRVSIQRQISVPTPKIQFCLKSLSLVEVSKEVLVAYERSFGTQEFHKAIEVSWVLQDGNVEVEDVNKPVITEESQTEEESQSQIRSRSSSDDKDTNTVPSDTTSQQDANCGEKAAATENGPECQQSDSQQQNAETDAGNKKKNRRDVKWWQMEGKRRSQRVRGHLMPVSPDKTKKESSFADQLKNLFPAPLLGDDGTSSERESAKTTEKSVWQKKHHPHYFGTKEEETHVKQLLTQMSGNNLASIIASLVEFLTTNVKYPWPSELREVFILLYQHYRSYVSYPNIQTYDFAQVIKDAFSCISFVEVVIEKYKTELSLGDKDFCKLAEKEIFFLEECLLSSEPIPKDLILRVKWVTVRRLLQMSLASNDDEVNGVVCSILAEMETELRNSSEPITVWTVNEISNLICLESVTEKAIGITKMQNSQVVTDLYQSHQYESLIGVLQTCINFSEIEKRDLSDIFYYTDALYRVNNSDCIHHCLNLINQAIRFQDNSSLAEALVLLEEIWEKMSHRFDLQDKRSIVGSLLKILVACERKPPSQESVLSVPWCLLHSVLFSLEREEPAFYLEEDTVPNSVLLLQMAHECMSRSEKCCVDNGKLMLYTMKEILKVKKLEEYFVYEETKLCMEQAIFCLYSHPSKKSKVKNLKDHNSVGTTLTWEMCPTLYQYYCPDELPEFDSTFSITTETEALFQRFLEIMPQDLKPVERQKQIEEAIKKAEKLEGAVATDKCFPKELKDIYYLIGDYYFKSKEWSKAVENYTLDLAVNESRFDSWAAIALCLGESINTSLNTADVIEFKDLAEEASSTGYCFNNALVYDPTNVKLRIEYGSFSYAIHACCSRLMKQQQATDIDMMRFQMIEKSKDKFLKCSMKCFELTAKSTSGAGSATETAEDELWIHHYMLGKINEKMKEDAEEFLKQYELAGKLLHVQGAPYPSKMNYYSPPELAIEALEIYYRVHASILSLVETAEYSLETEKLYLQFIRRQEESPFIKCKQSRGDGNDSRRGRKAAEDAVSKKDMAEISSLLNDLVQQAEKLVESGTVQSTTSSAVSTTTTEDDTSTDSVKSEIPKPTVHSFSLSEFRKRLQEKEEREEKLATESKKVDEPCSSPTPASPEKPEDIYEGLQLDSNIFYPAFKDVKYGGVISLCLKAMEECISRYPSHFKSYYRLAHSYLFFINDAKRAKEYLMGSPNLSQRKITGLFGERKPTNFFNGIWRNPSDDFDRPGSFSYHMNKTMHLLMDVLFKLNDHQQLADIGICLTKVPENEKKYLTNPDREMFCQQAWNSSIAAIKKISAEPTGNINELGMEIFETYTKFQKHNPRGSQNISTYLHDLYRTLVTSQGANDNNITVEHALRYFSAQHFLTKQNANMRVNTKGSSFGPSGDPLKPGGEGPPPRKRGRRNLRQTSQESVLPTLPTHQQDLEIYGAAFAAAFQANSLDLHKNPASMLPLSYLTGLPSSSVPAYPTMNIDPAVQAVFNNQLLNLTHADAANRGTNTPPSGHDSSKGAKGSSTSQYLHSSGFVPAQSLSKEFAQDKDRSSSNAVQTQPRPKPVRKNSKQEATKQPNKYPPPPSNQQPIRLNTSPYKTQSAVVEPPPEFSYKKKNLQSSFNQSAERSDPPIAHCQPRPQTEKKTEDDEIVEVIDLTVKTPEKDKDSSDRSVDRPPKTHKPVVSNPVFKPNPRLPAPTTFVDLRARARNPHPSIPSSTRVTLLNTSPNIPSQAPTVPMPSPPALSQRPTVPIPSPPALSQRPSGQINPRLTTVPAPKLTTQNTRQIIPTPRPNLGAVRTSGGNNPRPGTSNPRPAVANRIPDRVRPQVPQYPLPPKKKHLEYLEVQNVEEDDVEVICLDD